MSENKDIFSARSFFSRSDCWSYFTDAVLVLWALLTHMLLTGWPYCALALLVGAAFSTICQIFALSIVGSLLLPVSPHNQKVVNLLDAIIFNGWKRLCRYRVTYHCSIIPSEQYIFAESPHGVYPLASQMHATVMPAFHSKPVKLLAGSALYHVPLWRHYMTVGGGIPATRQSLDSALKDGYSVKVLVGGIGEMYTCEQHREVIIANKRRGFLRAALLSGVKVCPVYHFGNSQILHLYPRWLQPYCRRWRMSLGIYVGLFGCTPIPKASIPLWTVAGAPIDAGPPLPEGDPAFEARLQELHHKYIESLMLLYEQHKSQYFDGRHTWAARPLVVT